MLLRFVDEAPVDAPEEHRLRECNTLLVVGKQLLSHGPWEDLYVVVEVLRDELQHEDKIRWNTAVETEAAGYMKCIVEDLVGYEE